VETEIPKSLVVLVYPTTDGIQAERRRKLEFLGTVVDDRLRRKVREELGAAYSPHAMIEASQVLPGVGMLMIQAMADPDEVDDVVDACRGVCEELAESGVTEEEAERLREPILKSLRDARRQNGYWLEALSDAHRRPESLNELRSVEEYYRTVGPTDLSPLAEDYLGTDRSSLLIVNATDPANDPASDPANDPDPGEGSGSDGD
jgi:zinc protease